MVGKCFCSDVACRVAINNHRVAINNHRVAINNHRVAINNRRVAIKACAYIWALAVVALRRAVPFKWVLRRSSFALFRG